MRHVFKMTFGTESDWFSAESEADARSYAKSLYGGTEVDFDKIEQLPDDQPLKIYQDQPYEDPTPSITKTCAEWAAESEGIICTTSC